MQDAREEKSQIESTPEYVHPADLGLHVRGRIERSVSLDSPEWLDTRPVPNTV